MPDEGRRHGRAAALLSAWSALVVSVTFVSTSLVSADARLEDHAVTVVSAMRPIGRLACESQGTGLAVGDGLVLTAAHLLLDASDVVQSCKLPAWALAQFRQRPGDAFDTRVEVGTRRVVARLAHAGRRDAAAGRFLNFAASSDYAILRAGIVGETLHPCVGAPVPDRAVVVILPGRSVATKIAAAQTLKSGDDAGYVDLDQVFEQGTSGAGVLDAETRCVWGVISHRYPEPTPRVTRMTPVGVFAAAWRAAL